MTGARILLRRAQSTARRAKKVAAVTQTPPESDWTALTQFYPLPSVGFSKGSLPVLNYPGDKELKQLFATNKQLARLPIDMHSRDSYRNKFISEAAAAAGGRDSASQLAGAGAKLSLKQRASGRETLRAVQEAEEIILRRALRDTRDDQAARNAATKTNLGRKQG